MKNISTAIIYKGFVPFDNGTDEAFINGKRVRGEWVKGFITDETENCYFIQSKGTLFACPKESVCMRVNDMLWTGDIIIKGSAEGILMWNDSKKCIVIKTKHNTELCWHEDYTAIRTRGNIFSVRLPGETREWIKNVLT